MEKLLVLLSALAMIFIAAIVLAIPTMLLWNDIMPKLFGLVKIGFWQALELNLLSGILFKSATSSKSKD